MNLKKVPVAKTFAFESTYCPARCLASESRTMVLRYENVDTLLLATVVVVVVAVAGGRA